MSRIVQAALRAALVLSLVATVSPALEAQQQQTAQRQGRARLTSVEEALRAGGALNGRGGPGSVNWIDEGARFSFTIDERADAQRRDPQLRPGDLRATSCSSSARS